jgi:hypothetical protein
MVAVRGIRLRISCRNRRWIVLEFRSGRFSSRVIAVLWSDFRRSFLGRRSLVGAYALSINFDGMLGNGCALGFALPAFGRIHIAACSVEPI